MSNNGLTSKVFTDNQKKNAKNTSKHGMKSFATDPETQTFNEKVSRS